MMDQAMDHVCLLVSRMCTVGCQTADICPWCRTAYSTPGHMQWHTVARTWLVVASLPCSGRQRIYRPSQVRRSRTAAKCRWRGPCVGCGPQQARGVHPARFPCGHIGKSDTGEPAAAKERCRLRFSQSNFPTAWHADASESFCLCGKQVG